ncbi:MAG TPA: hypothetical protein VGG10_07090 [Rhizomicrobium sp.]|jgi:hypothetical protein
MIVRAIFWIAVVSFFMPREPDLGLGRPNGDTGGIAGLVQNAQTASTQATCDSKSNACAVGLGLLSQFRGVAVRSLAEVKADIEHSRQERAMERVAERN